MKLVKFTQADGSGLFDNCFTCGHRSNQWITDDNDEKWYCERCGYRVQPICDYCGKGVDHCMLDEKKAWQCKNCNENLLRLGKTNLVMTI